MARIRGKNRPAAGAALVLLLALGAGCEGEYVSATGVSPERAYADALLVPASELGAEWTEEGRAVAARTRFGSLDASWTGAPPPVVPEDVLETLRPEGPLAIWATVAYGREDDAGPPARLVATYLYRAYPPLPLGEEAELPPGLVGEWERGADGLAIGHVDPAATATSGEGAGTGGAAEVPPEEEDAAVSGDHGSSGDRADADDAVVFEPVTAGGEEDEAPVAASGEGDAAASGSDPGPDPESESEPHPEPELETGGETTEPPAAASESEEGGAAQTVSTGEDARETSAPEAEGRTIYLAADGVTIILRATDAVDADDLEAAVGAIRGRMAKALRAEQRMRENIRAIREERAGAVRVEKKANPGARAYWDLLEKASGKLIKITY